MPSRRRPNEYLRARLAEAAWSGQEFAAAINAAGAEAGTALHYDRKSVSHWLSGIRPRDPVPHLIAEALTRRLGRTIALADIGLGHEAAAGGDVPPDWDADISIEEATRGLWKTPPGRQRGDAAVYSCAALSVPGWSFDAPWLGRSPTTRGDSGKVGREHAEAAETMLVLFHHIDIDKGGGYGRQALGAYLAVEILPRLDWSMPARLRRRMFLVATHLTYLCAFMCFDDEQHGYAQQYYRTALRLAAANNDPTGYAITLRGMSVQASVLGHHREAVHLAEGALDAGRHGEPSGSPFLHGQLAVAHAAARDPVEARLSLSKADRLFDRTTARALVGAYHSAAFAHQQAAVQEHFGNRKEAIAALAESVRQRPPRERRSLAVTLARLAETQLKEGHLEESVTTWNEFLNCYPGLRSGRVTTAMRSLRAGMRPFAHHPAARSLLRRATLLI